MSTYEAPGSGLRPQGGSHPDERQPLAFEADFDGARRPQQASAAEELCDPARYWNFFSGTD